MILLSAADIRAAEAEFISGDVRKGYTLMHRAGYSAAALLNVSLRGFRRAVILAGKGNNAGDALVIARYLDIECVIYSVCGKNDYRGEAEFAAQELPENISYFQKDTLGKWDFMPGDVIIDGILGIGFLGDTVKGPAAGFIKAANTSGYPIISLDVPSGVDASTGKAADIAVKASATLMFGAVKSGLLNPAALEYCGKMRYIDIGLADGNQNIASCVNCYTQSEAYCDIAHFKADVHKNSRPRVLISAGCRNYQGAAQLNLLAALKCGAGIARLITSPSAYSRYPASGIVIACSSDAPDSYPVNAVSDNFELFEKSDVLLAGSGWGKTDKKVLTDVLSFQGITVLDADALNTLSCHPEIWNYRSDVVMTPHWGEALRLAEAFGVEVNGERTEFARRLAEKLNCVVVLKGPRSVTVSPDGEMWINSSGCNTLATAGSGDVLAGIVASAAAGASCGATLCRRTAFAVWVHGMAGEFAPYGTTADMLPELAAEVMDDLLNRKILHL